MAVWAALAMLLPGASPASAADMPAYRHIFVIMEENQSLPDIVDNAHAPGLSRLAHQYGLATQYYGVTHPSEGNYVALAGGDTYGIHDDDPFTCGPAARDPACRHGDAADYPAHTIDARQLGDQISAAGLSWKVYEQDIPGPGSMAPVSAGRPGVPAALYASKHDGFMNFLDVQKDPARASRIAGFDVLDRDIAAGTLPNYAFIVPNQCNDMHGVKGEGVPPDCVKENEAGRVARGDAFAAALADRLMRTAAWRGQENAAIVILWDEGGHHEPKDAPAGCCDYVKGDSARGGGGHPAAIVITNHGPRGVQDPTPYNHYSFVRTVEDAFGITDHLRHAGDDAQGIVAMRPLFAVSKDKH